MYGDSRFLDHNFLSDEIINAEITASSVGTGVLSGAQKDGTGSARLIVTGEFSGTESLVYTVQAHDVDAGNSVGQALYRWRKSSTAEGYWDATDITTHATPQVLDNGVYIQAASGTGNDFEEEDSWYFRAIATWQTAHMIDLNRGTVHRSDSLEDPNTYTIDLGDALNVTVFALYDHNIATYYGLVDVDGNPLYDVDGAELVTPSGSITLEANTSDSWGSPAYSQSLTITEDLLVFYLDQTYQWWRVSIQDYGTPLGVIEIGEMYLGDYFELEGNADRGSSEELDFFVQGERSPQGILEQQVFAEQTRMNLSYENITNDEIDTLKTFLRTLYDVDTGETKPFFFHFFNDEDDTFKLMRWRAPMPRSFNFVDQNTTSLVLEEEPKSRF